MIGLGTQDTFGEAEDFVATYGTVSFPMLWDETFDSWSQLGVSGQPAGMLFSADGTIITQWSGGIPEDDVLATIAGL